MSCAAGPTFPRSAPSCLSVVWWQSVTGICEGVHLAARCNQDENLLHMICVCRLLLKSRPSVWLGRAVSVQDSSS